MAQGEALHRISSHRSTYPIPILPFYELLYNNILLSLVGGLSSTDWSVRGLSGGGSIAATDGTITPYIPSSGFTLIGRQSKVLENRDLCRIVTSYIPKRL